MTVAVILLLLGMAAFVTLVVSVLLRRRGRGIDALLVANRSVWCLVVGGWMALAFVWGTTFFYLGFLPWTQGLIGVITFTIGNTGGLVLNMFLSWRTNRPNERLTYAEVIEEQYDAKTGTLVAAVMAGTPAFYALTFQFIVASKLVSFTWGVDPHTVIFWFAVAMTLPVVVGGLVSAEVEDSISFLMILPLFVLIPIAVYNAGVPAVVGGFGGHSLKTGADDSLTFVLATGIGLIVALVSAGAIDQTLYQRFFATDRSRRRGFIGRFMVIRPFSRSDLFVALVLGAIFFVLIHLFVPLLGFIAANPDLHVLKSGESPLIAAFAALREFLPAAATFFVLVVMVKTVASGDSALNGAGSVFLAELYKKRLRPQLARSLSRWGWSLSSAANDREQKFVLRLTMLLAILGAGSLAWTGINIITFTIFTTIFRAPLCIPIICGSVRGRGVPGMFWAIVVAMIVTGTLIGPGEVCKADNLNNLTPYWSHACSLLPFMAAKWYSALGALAGWAITGAFIGWQLIVAKRPVLSSVA